MFGQAGTDGDESGRLIGGPSECEHGHTATAFHVMSGSGSGSGRHIQLPAPDVVEVHMMAMAMAMASSIKVSIMAGHVGMLRGGARVGVHGVDMVVMMMILSSPGQISSISSQPKYGTILKDASMAALTMRISGHHINMKEGVSSSISLKLTINPSYIHTNL